MADDDYLRKLAARLGLPADATTNEDLERALTSRLGFDRWTEQWSARWLENLARRGQPGPTRVVQEPTPSTSGAALPGRRRTKERRR